MGIEGKPLNIEEQEEQSSKQNARGRKPKQESRAEEFRQRLMAWNQMPVRSRPSLRALARELGTSHQLLKQYLDGLEKWKRDKDLERIRANAKAKGVRLTPEYEEEYLAWVKDIEDREAQERRKYPGLAKKIAAAHEHLSRLIQVSPLELKEQSGTEAGNSAKT